MRRLARKSDCWHFAKADILVAFIWILWPPRACCFLIITTNITLRVAPQYYVKGGTARAQIGWSENPKNVNYFGVLAEYIFSLHEDIANTLLLDLFRTDLPNGTEIIRLFLIWKNGTFQNRSVFFAIFILRSQSWSLASPLVRFPLGPSQAAASYCYCLCLPSLCAIFSVLFLIRTSARLPACCTRLLPHTLCLLPCARCFGELLWDAAFCSNFGEQLWGTTLGSNFAALQHHWRTVFEERQLWGVALSKATLGSSFRQQL